jgi:hypothetical protein
MGELAVLPCVCLVVPRGDRYEDMWIGDLDAQWVDTTTGATLERHPGEYESPRSRELLRRMLGAGSTVRDGRGRRTFMLDGFLEREDGQEPIGVPAARKQRFPTRPTRGGWALGLGSARSPLEFDLVDPDSGATRRVPQPEIGVARFLSKRYLLRLGSVDRGRLDWRVLDLETGAEQPALAVPEDRSRAVVADEQILVACPVQGRSTLCLWNPVTGTREPLSWDGEPLRDVVLGDAKGPDRNDRWLLRLGKPGAPEGGLAVLDMRTRTVRLLTTARESHAFATELAIRDDGALLRIEREREIVLYGPESGRRQVLFPRPPGARRE